ncbi:pyridoxamine 5'-phosphate oxidase family protein [Microlunatus parietis]|uniref:Pyridoxamine 5'-phosphate oxidase n=1 Tax=Microlunatus parietis TaxID=682979 RepID=A0A7Y9I5U4_9ACTN|nr:pyridoxamine 5'-phosphate oxidase family protein [Microlunatus parietis]NYE70837.1 hypothetical protein [Microlunatus parietis]
MDSLSEAQCRRLLASTPVGRVVYTDQALPAIAVVNHRVRGDDIVFRADDGGRLAAAVHHSVVAFEADAVDPETAEGWTVVAVGEALRVESTAELESLADLGLRTWFGSAAGSELVRIRIQLLTGRATGGHTGPAAGHRAAVPLVSG